jgi:hypothetical protein
MIDPLTKYKAEWIWSGPVHQSPSRHAHFQGERSHTILQPQQKFSSSVVIRDNTTNEVSVQGGTCSGPRAKDKGFQVYLQLFIAGPVTTSSTSIKVQ